MGEIFNGLQNALGSALAFFYDLVPSYGLAIILLTVAVNLLLFPLTLKQTRSTRAFTAIQPEIRRIQKEYKDRPEEMQKELMRVQREAGATPGGCLLPLIVQFPIWLALFRVLSAPGHIPAGSALANAIAAGNNRFLGMDLGKRVSEAVAEGIGSALPYLGMLAVMVASQYVQTWHATSGQARPDNPQAAAGQAVSRIMPLFIGIVSYNFPAGLVLYWMTGNIFRLLQQIVIFKIDGRPQLVPADSGRQIAGKETSRGKADNSEAEIRKAQQGAADKRRRRRRK
ncbi:MAG TPA: YidC/Oxa1 family membrane protein insertase [Acidimicrobiia bacterium]|nr:YidC/Oxa1 family membrane protein insertase [Acidimicrobiia bacterium]